MPLDPPDSRADEALVLRWDDDLFDYVPQRYKAAAAPKEFRGPTDPQTVAGVVLNKRDVWDIS